MELLHYMTKLSIVTYIKHELLKYFSYHTYTFAKYFLFFYHSSWLVTWFFDYPKAIEVDYLWCISWLVSTSTLDWIYLKNICIPSRFHQLTIGVKWKKHNESSLHFENIPQCMCTTDIFKSLWLFDFMFDFPSKFKCNFQIIKSTAWYFILVNSKELGERNLVSWKWWIQ